MFKDSERKQEGTEMSILREKVQLLSAFERTHFAKSGKKHTIYL